MLKLIMIKYGELSTKKDNIGFFLNTLKRNVEDVLDGINYDIKYDKNRMFIFSEDIDTVIERVKKVFGIHEINICYRLDNRDLDTISKDIVCLVKEREFKTFKVAVKRSDKTYPIDSMELARKLGGVILKNVDGVKVDVHNPEILVNVEIRNDTAYIYMDKIKGAGGYPVGVLGKGLLMLSGGIDSPVAGYMAIKRGVKLECVYFESPPHTSVEAKNKVLELAKKLAVYNNGMKVHIINFTNIQESIYKNIPKEYLITIMRRMMYRISAIISHNSRGHIIVNGESIGQVASQTLTSMEVINEVVKMPVIRPVACFDKLEIIDIARKIDTYDISILPYEDCCTIFVPEHPVINPELNKCYEYEELIPYKELIYEAIKDHKIIKAGEDNKEFDELL